MVFISLVIFIYYVALKVNEKMNTNMLNQTKIYSNLCIKIKICYFKAKAILIAFPNLAKNG